ncbi:MAG: hypothetical protein R2853_19190 [Thermomicrobiales bacterium]
MEYGITIYGPATCVIRVQGVLAPDWSAQMAEMRIAVQRGEHRPITVLSGELTDQAALHGVLAALYELGLPLISVECTPFAAEEKVGSR